MALSELLSHKRGDILERWFQLVQQGYPDTGFRCKDMDRFTNPANYTLSRGIEVIYDELLGEMSQSRLADSLDDIIRIRTVQDFTPSQAIIFVFLLKSAIVETLAQAVQEGALYRELLEFESRIDKLALLAVDVYSRCREQIYELRIEEVKAHRDRLIKVMERAKASEAGQPE